MAEPTEEIQEILNFLLPFAEQMLSEHGEFYPYAAALGSDGELSAVGADLEDDDSPMSARFCSRSTRACASRRRRERSAHPGSRRT